MDKLPMQSFLALVRHGLTVAGGYLVANGFAAEEDLTTIVGAMITILGVVWSLYRKMDRRNEPTGSAL